MSDGGGLETLEPADIISASQVIYQLPNQPSAYRWINHMLRPGRRPPPTQIPTT